MGVQLEAFIKNTLTKKEILSLAKRLNKERPLAREKQNWKWQEEDIDEIFLEDYWKRDQDWYMGQLNAKKYDQIYKGAIIWGSDVHIHFYHPNLSIIGFMWKWSVFQRFPEVREKVEIDLKRLADFLGFNECILTSELSGGKCSQELEENARGDLSTLIECFDKENRKYELLRFQETT